MTKRVKADDYEVIARDETGALLSLDYTRPYCEFENHVLTTVKAEEVHYLDDKIETDQSCEWCNEDVIVECL